MEERQYHCYTRETGRYYEFVMAAIVGDQERRSLPWSASVVARYQAQENGLPTKDELKRIHALDALLITEFEKLGNVDAGHITTDGCTRFFFYGPTQGPAKVSVKTGLFKKSEFAVEWRHDPEWSVYENCLAPTVTDLMLERFRPLWKTLAEHGDDFDQARPVDFSVHFPTAADRTAFLAEAEHDGFALSQAGTWDAESDYWCELVRTTPIEPTLMLPICIRLHDMAERHHGEFDGWACPIVKPA